MEKKHLTSDDNPEVIDIRRDDPILRDALKNDKTISPEQSRIVKTKAQKQNANKATVEMHRIKQKEPWYTPVIKFCSWVKRTVLSWFK